jgi:hypothetical protein
MKMKINKKNENSIQNLGGKSPWSIPPHKMEKKIGKNLA